jgi:hypothetical protein
MSQEGAPPPFDGCPDPGAIKLWVEHFHIIVKSPYTR